MMATARGGRVQILEIQTKAIRRFVIVITNLRMELFEATIETTDNCLRPLQPSPWQPDLSGSELLKYEERFPW